IRINNYKLKELNMFNKRPAQTEQDEKNESGMVKLKNGTEAPTIIAAIVCRAIQEMWDGNDYMAVYNLAMHCRDPKYTLSAITQKKLREKALMVNGEVPEVTKNIVLCATEGDGHDMKLCSPLQAQPSSRPVPN